MWHVKSRCSITSYGQSFGLRKIHWFLVISKSLCIFIDPLLRARNSCCSSSHRSSSLKSPCGGGLKHETRSGHKHSGGAEVACRHRWEATLPRSEGISLCKLDLVPLPASGKQSRRMPGDALGVWAQHDRLGRCKLSMSCNVCCRMECASALDLTISLVHRIAGQFDHSTPANTLFRPIDHQRPGRRSNSTQIPTPVHSPFNPHSTAQNVRHESRPITIRTAFACSALHSTGR